MQIQPDFFKGLPLFCLLLFSFQLTAKAQAPSDVVAKVNGRSITAADVDRAIIADVFPLQQQLYSLRKIALDNLVVSRLLETEAAKRNITVEELRKQLTAFQIDVPNEKVNQVYAENAKAFESMSPDEAKERLRLDLESQGRIQKYREALAKFKETAQIELYLEEPRFPPINIGMAPVKGSANSPIQLIEFSDFQCPFCRSSQATLRDLLKSYAGDVTLVYKHRPLEIHSDAFAAAQAAFCAHQQEAFWTYHDALFASDDLSAASLRKLAADNKLDLKRFDACIASDRSRQAVQDDLDEARRLGINSTPTFVINGRVVRGALTLEEFKTAIDKELQSVKRTNP